MSSTNIHEICELVFGYFPHSHFMRLSSILESVIHSPQADFWVNNVSVPQRRQPQGQSSLSLKNVTVPKQSNLFLCSLPSPIRAIFPDTFVKMQGKKGINYFDLQYKSSIVSFNPFTIPVFQRRVKSNGLRKEALTRLMCRPLNPVGQKLVIFFLQF